MRLGIDSVGSKHGGGSVVLTSIVEAALADPRFEQVVLYLLPRRFRQFDVRPHERLTIVEVEFVESGLGRVWWALYRQKVELVRRRINIVLGVNGIIGGRQRSSYGRVVFIQQSAPYSEEAMKLCSVGTRLRMAVIKFFAKRSVKVADHVLVQTEPMRQTVVNCFGINPQSISAYLPTAPNLDISAGCERCSLTQTNQQQVLLYVGNDEPYKNLEVVQRALAAIPVEQRPEWHVTLSHSAAVCQSGFAKSLGTVARSELLGLYSRATAVVMPSLTETVGLPMLEAMRAGTPILAADRPYARAVCEDSCLFFDPLSASDLSAKLRSCLRTLS